MRDFVTIGRSVCVCVCVCVYTAVSTADLMQVDNISLRDEKTEKSFADGR